MNGAQNGINIHIHIELGSPQGEKMAKKLNSNDRKRLLEVCERGLTDSEIKARFGITDDRTLRRHLKLAEQEQEIRLVKTEILKKALGDHVDKLGQLIENWKMGIRIQPVADPTSDMAVFLESLHSNRLFDCLKDHLPFPILWREYNQWEAKYRSYIDNCKKLQEEIRREATTQMSLDFMGDNATVSHLSPRLIDWILRQVEHKLQKVSGRGFEFLWKDFNVEQPTEFKQMSVNPGGELLQIYNQHEVDKEFYEKQCRELLDSCLKGETVANLLLLLDDLYHLEPKIHNSLEEILLRRDYILYDCNLCPGRPRLLR